MTRKNSMGKPVLASIASPDARKLRRQVLRPGQSEEAVTYAGDEAIDTLHAAVRYGGILAGVATVVAEPPPGSSDVDAWHLRGMAVLPEHQRHGYGSALVAECLSHVRAHGGKLVWCNARVSALGFYQRLGFHAVGQQFHLPGAGDHYLMLCELP
jgi:ribosomal protein S18 acetylase RimI-like enzyme